MKFGHDAAVIRMHPRTISIEDAGHANAKFVLAVIIEEKGFGAPFAFVVAGAHANRIDVPPIIFCLRMNVRVAVHFTGRCLKDAGV